MAGGVSRAVGAVLAVLGGLLLLVGLGAGGYGFLREQEQDDQLLRSSDDQETNQAFVLGGAAAAGVGLVLLVFALVALGMGGALRHRDLVRAAGGAKAGGDAPRSSRRPVWIAVGIAALLVAAAGVYALSLEEAGGRFQVGGSEGAGLIFSERFHGNVTGGSLGPAGSTTPEDSESTRLFKAPAGTKRIVLTMDWTPAPAGDDELRLILDMNVNEWQEIGRSDGPSPRVIEVATPYLDGASLRYRVFPTGVGPVAQQPFSILVSYFE